LPVPPVSAIFDGVRRFAALGAFLAAGVVCDRADATELLVACTRLDEQAAEELSARLRLTLREHPRPPESIVVACDAERAWVIWQGPPLEMLPVSPDGEVREAVLDVVESRLRALPDEPRTAKPGPNEVPSFEQPAKPPPPPPPRRAAPTGGLGTGVMVESLGDPFGMPIGPRLDIGIGWAPFTFIAWESPRFGQNPVGDTFFFSLETGLAWGAPYVRDYLIGAAATAGVEWFALSGDTQSTGAATLGIRAAVPVGPLWLWLGVDGRTRFAPPTARDDMGGALPRYSGAVTLGLMLTVEVPTY
jgi:hypothetical protein